MIHETFTTMSTFLKENAEEWHQPESDWAYCWGKIKGYSYRCFQETVNDVTHAYVVIKFGPDAGDTMWPAYYSIEEIQSWLNSL